MIRWRGLFILIVPLIALVPLIVWGSLTLYQQTLRDVVSERDQQTARAAAAALTEQLERRGELVRGIADQASVTSAADYDTLLDSVSFLDTEFDGGIAIFDLVGNPIAVYNVIRDDVIDWPFPGSRPTPFSEPAMNPRTGQLEMRVTATTEFVQVVAAFDASQLANEVLATVLNDDVDISAFIVDTNGNRICTIGMHEELQLGAEQQFCVTEALAGNSGTLQSADPNGESDRVIAFTPIEPVGWALVTEVPLQVASNPRLNALLIAPLILVPVVLIALGAVWFGDRQILRPLQQLEQKAAALGQGVFDNIEQDVGGIDAVRSLQSELVHMARRVERTQQNLRSQVGAITLGQEEERRRLARELHDDTIQSLIALNQRVQLTQLRANSDQQLSGELVTLQQMIGDLLNDLRRFTRALRPVGLEELGLFPAVELLVDNLRDQSGVAIQLTSEGEPRRLPLSDEFTLYRITQEALNNLIQHADASAATVRLTFGADTTTVEVEDNGRGFDVPVNSAEMATIGNFGLLGMHERAELIGANLKIISIPDYGTRLILSLATT